jgi:hypothetical protein
MMWATSLIATALALVGAPDVKNRALAEGIQLYDALDYSGALAALTQALDKPSTKRDFARIHLYIGLIQHRYKLPGDAEASFTKALDYYAKMRPPKGATKGARALFRKILKAKFGDALDLSEARAEDGKPKKKSKALRRRFDDETEDDTGSSEGDSTDSSTTATQRAEGGNRAGGGGGDGGRGGGSSGAIAMSSRGGHPPAIDDAGVESDDELPSVTPSPPPEEGANAVEPPAGTVEARRQSPLPVIGWVSIGVGVAAVATGITLGALSAKNGSAALTEPVASRAEQLHSTAVQQRTFAFVSFGVSGAALGLAAVLFLTEE